MDDFLGEIRLFGPSFDPKDWLLCDGQALSKQQYGALYSVIGDAYTPRPGGATFNLPDLRERVLIGAGAGPGLTPRALGAAVGEGNVTLTPDHLPPHSHGLEATVLTSSQSGTTADPTGAYFADSGADSLYGEDTDSRTMAPGLVSGDALPNAGGNPHLNLMPTMVMRYVICIKGHFPG